MRLTGRYKIQKLITQSIFSFFLSQLFHRSLITSLFVTHSLSSRLSVSHCHYLSLSEWDIFSELKNECGHNYS